MPSQVEILKKLIFDVSAELGEPEGGTTDKRRFTFIYGIVPEGLSDFERALNGLSKGETFTVSVHDINAMVYFDRLFLIFTKQTELVDFRNMKNLVFELKDVQTPGATEIVSAMAEVQKTGGCSGDCDCGCGGH